MKMKAGLFDVIICLLILVLKQHVFMTYAADELGENILYTKLLHSYQPTLRPVRRHYEKVNVTVDLGLTEIFNMDERHQVLIWNGWVRQSWIDYRLAWNTSEYSNINDIAFEKSSIWTPDMAIYNNAQENFQLLDAEAFEKIVTHSDGKCQWMVPFVFKTICKIDITYFPFDEQVCEFEIGSWAYTGAYLNISYMKSVGDLSQYSENSAWLVLKLDAGYKVGNYSCCPEPYPSLIFKMHLRRRALYYVYKIIIPSCLIAVLALLSFFLPTSSGERVALLITNFVSLALFILMLSTIVPPTSDTTPLIEVYLTAVFVEISAALLLRCVIDVAKRKHGRPGFFVRRFVCYYLARLMCTKPLRYAEVIAETDITEDNIEMDAINLKISNDVEIFKAVHNGNATSAMTETMGVVNGAINEVVSHTQANLERLLSIDEGIIQAGSNTADDDRLSMINLQEFKAKILNVVESVSGAAKQKCLTKNRRRKYDDDILNLDIVFFCLFALTISVTVAVIFATPPKVVI